MPTLSPFLPLYLRALQRVPDRLAAPTDKPDATSLYWIMRRLQARAGRRRGGGRGRRSAAAVGAARRNDTPSRLATY